MRHPSRFLKNLFGSTKKTPRTRLQLGTLEDRTVPSGNDTFATATVIPGTGPFPYTDTGDTTGATGEVGETALFGSIESHWYSFMPAVTAVYQIDGIGSSIDAFIGITTGGSVNGVSYLATDGFSASGQGKIVMRLNAGTTYRIAVDDVFSGPGAYTLNISTASPPANDDFANSDTSLSGFSDTAMGTNDYASAQVGEPTASPGADAFPNSVWWSWTAPATGSVTVDTLGSSILDPRLEVFSGNTLGTLVSLGANDDTYGLQSEVIFSATAGTTYHFRVEGFGFITGGIQLNVLQDAPSLDITPSTTNAIRNESVDFLLDNYAAPGGNAGGPFTITVNWGDGSPDTVVGPFADLGVPGSDTVSHAWTTTGAKTVTVTFMDNNGNFTTETVQINVTVVRVDGGGNLLVSGTAGDDQFLFDQGPSPSASSTSLRVFVNGQFQGTFGSVAGPGVTLFTGSVRTFGDAGIDTTTLLGTTGDDDFTLADGVPVVDESDRFFELNGREYTTLDTENFVFKGLEGNDDFIVDFLDSAAIAPNVTIEGGNGNDRLLSGTGLTDVDDLGGDGALWNIQGPQRGALETSLVFNTIENIVGNSEDDTFVVASGGIMTNLGAVDAIDAGGGTNTADFSAQTASFVYTASATGVLTTSAGRIAGVDVLLASALGANRLVGATMPANAANTWDITAANGGTYTAGANAPIDFSNIGALTGGGNVDTFAFDGGSLTGNLDGAAGNDVLDYSAELGPVTTSMNPAKTDLVGGTWASFSTFIGSADGGDTFKGNNVTNAWNLTGAGTGNLNTTTLFSSYENLVGGSAVDTFNMGAAPVFASLSGGTGGTDTLNYLNYATYIDVDLTTNNSGTVSAGTAAFSGIDSFVGKNGVGSDTIHGTAAGDNILITAQRTGKINTVTSFSNFETLVGDAGNDKYTVQTTFPLGMMSIDGGLEVTGDTLVAANQANTWTLTGTGTGTLMGTGDILANALDFTGIEHLTGGTGIDTFDLSAGDIAGSIVGGNGNDILNVGANAVTLTTTTAGTTAVIGGTFTSIENLMGDGTATLTGPNLANIWKLTGSNAGKLGTTLFSGFSDIVGGTSTDRLTFGAGGTLTGTFNGAGGVDTLDYSGVLLPVPRPYTTVVTGNVNVYDGTNSLAGFINIDNMEVLTGNK